MELEVVDGGFAVDIEISAVPPVSNVALAVVRGETGATGATGATGGVGPQGVSGQVGERGPAGERGEQGIQGIQGVAGAPGSVGPQGSAGAAGAQGVQGVPGQRGEKGDKGDTGEQGVAGVSLDIQGSVATYANLPVNAVAGDAWIVLADGKLYYRDATGFPANGAGVPFQGPQGIPGVAGARGDQGIQGIQGIQGERGEVGTVGTAGVAGATGTQGVAGVQGVAGADGQGFVWRGVYSGSSTYAANDVVSFSGSSFVALIGGVTQSPVASPSSWAAMSLKGDTGDTGDTGATGPAGAVGATGPAGPAGESSGGSVDSTATAAGTTTLTIASGGTQIFTGTAAQTVLLPTTGVVAGQTWTIVNSSTGTVTVQSSGAATVATLTAGLTAECTALVATPTTAANWQAVTWNGSGVVAPHRSNTVSFTGNNQTVTLTAASAGTQIVSATGSYTNNNIVMPSAGIRAGQQFTFTGAASGGFNVTSGGQTLVSSYGGTWVYIAIADNPSSPSGWTTAGGIPPAAGGFIVSGTAGQTLFNKTLSSPRISSGSVPATATATGLTGQIQWNADFIYVCTATNTWRRAALTTW